MEPVAHVMAMEETVVGATGEAAGAVAQPQGAPDGGGDSARATADVENLAGGGARVGARLPRLAWLAGLAHDGGDDAAVAGDPTKRFRGNGRAVVQAGGDGGDLFTRTQEIAVEMNDDLMARGGD